MNSADKIIFLDIDGVINTFESWRNEKFIEKDLLQNLEKIVEQSGAKIVISSSWMEEGIELLKEHGFKYTDAIIGVTPRKRKWRGEQILQWMEENGKPESYVVIDDETFDICGPDCNAIPRSRVVVCDSYEGLCNSKVEEIIVVLNTKEE